MADIDKKYEGFLHDPMDKVLCIVYTKKISHESRAGNIAPRLVDGLPPHIINNISQHHSLAGPLRVADANASAANRGLIPHGSQVKEIVFQNPFSGSITKLRRLRTVLSLAPCEAFQKVATYSKDLKDFIDLFWNMIKSYYSAYLGSIPLAQSIFILPEDSRIPSSPIISHLLMTSALSGCSDNFYLVYIDIGGVQEFISNARKTRDLWAGSYIYSLLSATIIEYIAKTYGPDSIIMPWIMNIPLIEAKLFKSRSDKDILLPLVPSTILAIICPGGNTPESIRNEILSEIKSFWDNLVREYISNLRAILEEHGETLDEKAIKESMKFEKIFTKVRILILDYKKAQNSILLKNLDEIGGYAQLREIPVRKCSRTCRGCQQYSDHLEYQHQPLENFESYIKLLQIGAGYSKYAVKFEGKPEIYKKKEKACMACGASKQAFPSDDPRWEILEKKRIVDLGEKLCHVCLLKRTLLKFIHRVLGLKQEISLAIPSTSDVGTTWFKVSFLALFLATLRIGTNKIVNKALYFIRNLATNLERLIKLLDFSKEIAYYKRAVWSTLLRYLYGLLKKDKTLKKLAEEESSDIERYLKDIEIIIYAPGELFRRESVEAILSYDKYKEKREEAENYVKNIENLIEHWTTLISDLEASKLGVLEEARRIILEVITIILSGGDSEYARAYRDLLEDIFTSFSKAADANLLDLIPIATKPQDSLRFCIIRADGDFIGRWISGDMGVPWLIMHHPDLVQPIQKLQKITDNILKRSRPVSPSYLSTLSMTLSFNALFVARIIEAFSGFLIYTGGDDVLAIVPPEVWHLVYLLLRTTFSSEIILNRALKEYKEGIYTYGMSWRATQSYGVVIAHHKADLRWVLRTSIELEEQSKKFSKPSAELLSKYDYKTKDAISVALLGRGAIISKTEPLPNILIKCGNKILTVREYDEELLERLRSSIMSQEAYEHYKEKTKKIISEKRSSALGEDIAFKGIVPKAYSLSENEAVVSLPAFAYRYAHLARIGKISRAVLIELERIYEEKSKYKKCTESDSEKELKEIDLFMLKYSLKKKLDKERLGKDVAIKIIDELFENTKILAELSKKHAARDYSNVGLLSVYSLAEIIRRCLNKCRLGGSYE